MYIRNDYVIADTMFGSIVLWASEKVSHDDRKSNGSFKIAYRPKYKLATRGSRVTLAVTLVLLSSLHSSRRISKQKSDCSRSTEYNKINIV